MADRPQVGSYTRSCYSREKAARLAGLEAVDVYRAEVAHTHRTAGSVAVESAALCLQTRPLQAVTQQSDRRQQPSMHTCTRTPQLAHGTVSCVEILAIEVRKMPGISRYLKEVVFLSVLACLSGEGVSTSAGEKSLFSVFSS